MSEVELIERISPISAKVYLFLLRTEGSRSFTSLDIGDRLGLSRGAVENAKRELRTSGLIETDNSSKVTIFYLPYDVSSVVQSSTREYSVVHESTPLCTHDVRAKLDPPLESLHNVKSEATVQGRVLSGVLRVYAASFPGKPKPSYAQAQSWVNEVGAEALVEMLGRMAGKDIASPIGYVASAVKREAEKRKEQGAPGLDELEAEKERGLALVAQMRKVKRDGEAVIDQRLSDRIKRKNSTSC